MHQKQILLLHTHLAFAQPGEMASPISLWLIISQGKLAHCSKNAKRVFRSV
jgi:hypothetical protein